MIPSLHPSVDDGPDPATPRLLDLLEKIGAGATFFPVAPRATAQPHLIGRILTSGHNVGVHCHVHARHSEQEHASAREDTARALRALGADPRLWRTPRGEMAPFTASVAQGHGLRIVGWTHDTHPWRGDSAADMFADQTLEFVRLIGARARTQGLQLEAIR